MYVYIYIYICVCVSTEPYIIYSTVCMCKAGLIPITSLHKSSQNGGTFTDGTFPHQDTPGQSSSIANTGARSLGKMDTEFSIHQPSAILSHTESLDPKNR